MPDPSEIAESTGSMVVSWDACTAAESAADRAPLRSRTAGLCIAVIVPTYNAEPHWPRLQQALAAQGVPPDHVLIIDSSSTDRTPELVRDSGFRFVTIPQAEFNHGGTRQLASTYFPNCDALVLLTQDAIPTRPDTIAYLCRALEDPAVGAAYGRQLGRQQANAIERHARLFNYPAASYVRSFEDRHAMGIRAAFLSNSFAVYRRTALEEIGGFPANVILAEDSYVAARMLAQSWKVAYVSEAEVIHSHGFSIREEFARYFDIGVHHSREPWMLADFGAVNGEGLRFVRSEFQYLRQHAPGLIPEAAVRTASKLIAYRLGKAWQTLPFGVTRRLSGSAGFWNSQGPRR